jgi:hypothetical protein
MNAFLTLLFVTLLLCGAVALLLPVLTLVAALGLVLGICLLPILLIADSDQTTGGEKVLPSREVPKAALAPRVHCRPRRTGLC